jgi:hypothetical protein
VIDVLDPKECCGRVAKFMDDDPVYKTPTINLQDEHGLPIRKGKKRKEGEVSTKQQMGEQKGHPKKDEEVSTAPSSASPKHTKKEGGGDRGGVTRKKRSRTRNIPSKKV